MSPSHRNEPPPYPKYGDRPQDVPARYLRTLTNIVDQIKTSYKHIFFYYNLVFINVFIKIKKNIFRYVKHPYFRPSNEQKFKSHTLSSPSVSSEYRTGRLVCVVGMEYSRKGTIHRMELSG